MKKKLKFASDLVPLVLNGSKTATWRLFDDKNLSVGDTVDFLEHGTEKQFGTAKITHVIEKPLGELSEEDKEGHEQFESAEKMYRVYTNYYEREVTAQSIIKIVRFTLLS